METYASQPNFPPKAGVYAVRAGPILAQNVTNYIQQLPLTKYIPQKGFLSLLMTADGKAIGTKFGIAFSGRWVWNMKDYIDMGFMKLFDPHYLFKDFETKRFAEPLEKNELFDDEKKEEMIKVAPLREKVATMDPQTAAKTLKCEEDEIEFYERLFIIDRMGKDESYAKDVVDEFKILH